MPFEGASTERMQSHHRAGESSTNMDRERRSKVVIFDVEALAPLRSPGGGACLQA